MRRFLPLIKASLIPLLVVLLLGGILRCFEHPSNPDSAAQVSDIEPFLGHLQSLWDRYLEMVQLLITLLTGVIAVSAGMVKFGPKTRVVDREDFASALLSLLIGLGCAIFWRIDSELLMEIEIFGNPGRVRALYILHGVTDPFTSSFNYADHIHLFSWLARIFMAGTAVGLIVGLALLSQFAYKNLPEATPQQSKP